MVSWSMNLLFDEVKFMCLWSDSCFSVLHHQILVTDW